jgi:SAM-dependent methyltransferase
MLRRPPRPGEPPPQGAPRAVTTPAEPVVASRAFPKFLSTLAGREHSTFIDLGPAVGSNLEFFAERTACKFFFDDLFAEIEAQAAAGTREKLATLLPARIAQPDASVDAVLCWDIFDFLDKAAAQGLARELVRVLKPGGALFGFFYNQIGQQKNQYTKFIIEDESHFRHRTSPATPVQVQVLPNRDIIRLFEGLLVSDSYLLLTHTREIVFRKK